MLRIKAGPRATAGKFGVRINGDLVLDFTRDEATEVPESIEYECNPLQPPEKPGAAPKRVRVKKSIDTKEHLRRYFDQGYLIMDGAPEQKRDPLEPRPAAVPKSQRKPKAAPKKTTAAK